MTTSGSLAGKPCGLATRTPSATIVVVAPRSTCRCWMVTLRPSAADA